VPFENFNPVPHLDKYAHIEDMMSKQDKRDIEGLIKKLRTIWTSEPLTPMQRAIAAMMGGDLDRVPYTPILPKSIGMRKIGCDYVKYYMDPVANMKTNLITAFECKGDSVQGYLPIDMGLSDVYGTKWKFLPNSLPVVTQWGVKGFDQMLDNPTPDPRESRALKWQLETARFLTEKLGDLTSCAANFILGPYYQYNSCLRGPVDGFYDIKKRPDDAVKVFDKLYAYLADYANYLIEQTQVPSVIIIDSLAAPSFTSPAWFQKFCAPYNKKLLENIPAMWTIAGGGQGKTDFTPLLETYADMGYGSFMFGPPTDLNKMKQISNKKGTVIMHWALTQEMLRWYTPKQIEERVKECLKIGAPGGRYLLGTDVPDDESPLENFLAARESLLKYGKYPLKFD
jgi:uroporphyrinogen-III decarboxylase